LKKLHIFWGVSLKLLREVYIFFGAAWVRGFAAQKFSFGPYGKQIPAIYKTA
jgi:hypothetical protein